MGASLGREAAPKLMGGVAGSALATWARLSPAQRRLLAPVAEGRGSRRSTTSPWEERCSPRRSLWQRRPPTILPALACSWIATAVAWLFFPTRHLPRHSRLPVHDHTVPLGAARRTGCRIAVVCLHPPHRWVSHHRISGRGILITFPLAMARARPDRHRVSATLRQR